ncbi:MAG: hypothetical protein JW847_09275 [Candidatus Omnitrophica bacterium]|nr:hypothetical protein [Candidatus Omnitrophota bacterium]
MINQAQKGSVGVMAMIVIAAVIIGIAMANRWLQKQTDSIGTTAAAPPIPEPGRPEPVKKTSTVRRTGEVIRETRYSPDRKYEINVFYQDGKEIARNRTTNGEVYDQEGEIPDGKVKFVNVSTETYGVEYYRNQKLHGPANIYYSDDVLKQELVYQNGKLITNTEYYHDGTVRMQEDFTDARALTNHTEKGMGKVYFRDGTVKYEWHLTVTEPIGYLKSYDRKGNVVDAVYFDEFGQAVDPQEAIPVVETPSDVEPSQSVNDLQEPDSSPIKDRPPKQIFIPAS